MAEEDNQKPIYNVIRDPKLVKNRIFIGNLPACTREELEGIAIPYGKILAVHVQKNFGFVQYESEEIATSAAKILNKSIFKGNKVTVRNAGTKPVRGNQSKNYNVAGVINTVDIGRPNHNDCEIIVLNRQNTKYAEYIESCLNQLGLYVDVLFPIVPLSKVLGNISEHGCSYAIVITMQHEENKSVTLHILHGVASEHRNMLLEDAIKLIGDHFHARLQREGKPIPQTIDKVMNPDVPPDQMQMLLNSLNNNLPLTANQYDSLIQHLRQRRIMLASGEESSEDIDPEIMLQRRIFKILNKSPVEQFDEDPLGTELKEFAQDQEFLDLLEDVGVLNALQDCLQSDLFNIVGKHY